MDIIIRRNSTSGIAEGRGRLDVAHGPEIPRMNQEDPRLVSELPCNDLSKKPFRSRQHLAADSSAVSAFVAPQKKPPKARSWEAILKRNLASSSTLRLQKCLICHRLQLLDLAAQTPVIEDAQVILVSPLGPRTGTPALLCRCGGTQVGANCSWKESMLPIMLEAGISFWKISRCVESAGCRLMAFPTAKMSWVAHNNICAA